MYVEEGHGRGTDNLEDFYTVAYLLFRIIAFGNVLLYILTRYCYFMSFLDNKIKTL